jgi:hypothetical protein
MLSQDGQDAAELLGYVPLPARGGNRPCGWWISCGPDQPRSNGKSKCHQSNTELTIIKASPSKPIKPL